MWSEDMSLPGGEHVPQYRRRVGSMCRSVDARNLEWEGVRGCTATWEVPLPGGQPENPSEAFSQAEAFVLYGRHWIY